MCEDIANQLNFIKNKNANTSTPSIQSTPTTMLELLGGVGAGTVKKEYLTFNTTAEEQIQYTVTLKITNSTSDEQFEAHVYFDDNLMGKKIFTVNSGQATVLYDFAYTSPTGTIDVKIVVCAGQETTRFCLDQIITIATTNTLTCDYPNKCDDVGVKLSVGYLGSPNLLDLGNTYNYVFQRGTTMYTGLIESKYCDVQRFNYYYKTSPLNFGAFATLGTHSDGSVGYGESMMFYTTSARTYALSNSTKIQKTTSLLLQKADIQPYSLASNVNVAAQGIMQYNQTYSYNTLSTALAVISTYPITFPDNNLVSKIIMCKPKTVQEAQVNLPFIMIDADKNAFIYYNYQDAQSNSFFSIANVQDACCVFGTSLTDVQVYAIIDGVCYLYKLRYNTSTKTFTQRSKTTVGEFALFYPGFDDDAFYMIGDTMYFTKHKDLL